MEKAFLQVALSEEDRDATRFLWIRPGWAPGKIPEVYVLRMTRVLFGATCSPFLLAATVRLHAENRQEEFPATCKVLDDDLYVDDLISGTDDDEKAYKLYREAKSILAEVGMSLRKWMSNSEVLRQRWKEEGEPLKIEGVVFNPRSFTQKILGLLWDPFQDELSFQTNFLTDVGMEHKSTKRSILKGVARVFDPLGLISPVLIAFKCLFQEVWEQNLHWDEELPKPQASRWWHWCQDLKVLAYLPISRRYDDTGGKKLNQQLHVFCDASTKAYGAAVYLRTVRGDSVTTSLVVSKSRVAPLKRLTLPRLELMSNLIGARLVRYVKTTLPFEDCSVRVWTDSTVALHWITSQTRLWKPFVANRITEINSLVDSTCWGHCLGTDNPADLLTRGESVQRLRKNKLWWEGPTWLREEKTSWPKRIPTCSIQAVSLEKVEAEIKDEIKEKKPCSFFWISRSSAVCGEY